ncbi:MAG: sodium:solute symporter family protein [Planctomycetota bacterium]|nr:sodium:solute symporter family protein [Planctomycetota bacterium]
MSGEALLGTGGMVFMGAYLVSLLLVGVVGRMARKENTLADFYLSGRNMGMFVLLMTLYATQYSGNTLIGFTGQTYRGGYKFLVSVTFMMGVIAAYLCYAPRLFKLSRSRDYITPGDFLQDRFGCRALTNLATILFIIALANYVLTNLKAIGAIVESTTGGNVSAVAGIIGLSLIMVVYETLGGMRSVAWTDMIQGILLLLGCVLIFAVIQMHYGGLSGAAEELMQKEEFWKPPAAQAKVTWMSRLLLIALGISIYPHAVQRIFAAKSESTLKRSLQIMVFMPIFTTFFMIVVGLAGAAKFPGLDKAGSEKITLIILSDLAQSFPAIKFLLILFLSAAVAAIMSTVDSALLSISSMVAQDLYLPMKPDTPQARLTFAGKIISWAVMAGTAALALVVGDTIWTLIKIKLELLCQLVPAIFLGVQSKSLKAKPVFAGLAVGTVVTVGFLVFEKFGPDEVFGWQVSSTPFGIHAGVLGLALNLAVLATLHVLTGNEEK